MPSWVKVHLLTSSRLAIVFSLAGALVEGAGQPDWTTTLFRSGVLLAFCGGRKNSASDSGDIDIVLKRSTDGDRSEMTTSSTKSHNASVGIEENRAVQAEGFISATQLHLGPEQQVALPALRLTLPA